MRPRTEYQELEARLGLTGEAKRRVIRAASEAAEKATRWPWIKRAELGHRPGSDQPRASDVEGPETPSDPRLHHR